MGISFKNFAELWGTQIEIEKMATNECQFLNCSSAIVIFDRYDDWNGKNAAIYRVEFFNSNHGWIGNSYVAVFDDGSIDYDSLD